MATQPTNLPVPSESPRDLKFNAGKIDEFVTSMGWTYTDRFGQQHYTIEGINYIAQQAMVAFGYVILTGKTFTTGATLNSPNEVLLNTADGEYYKWTGSFASGGKIVPAGSTPASSGGIGPGAWIGVGDASLRSDLASGGKAALVGYGSTTVKGALDDLYAANAAQNGKTGFDTIGRFLNLAELRAQAPSSTGQIVFVASAASATAAEKHYGGGYFQSFDNSVSPLTDDGGIVIIPSTGTLAWRRINFTAYDMQFWGVKPDGATDNAAAITKAVQFAKTNHVELIFPSGNVKSSQAFPFYSRMSVRGSGRESSFFSKTTNNAFTISTGVTADALLVFLPDVYNPTGTTMDTFCFKPKLEGITFQRDAVTASNMCYYSVWAEKLAAPVMRDLNFIGHYIGMYGKNWFLFEATSVQFLGINGRTYEGISCVNVSGSTYSLSGTSLNWHLVSVVNAQISYDIAGQQYCHLDTCTAEGIKPIPGETLATAFRFTNPTSITLTSCGTESVQGEQFRVEMKTTPSFKGSVVITNFQTVDQVNPATPTKFFVVDSAGAGTLSVSLIGGELTRNTSLPNLQQPTLSGTNCVLSNVGCWVEAPATAGGAVYKAL
jgi:hypothetical protein